MYQDGFSFNIPIVRCLQIGLKQKFDCPELGLQSANAGAPIKQKGVIRVIIWSGEKDI